MSGQPEALRLANEFNLCKEYDSIPSMNDIAKAEAELRRLHARIAELEADHFEDKLDMVARWYMVDKDGMATLCTDREDAEQEAKDANMSWPHTAPHRAVQLVEVGTLAAELHHSPTEGMAGGWIALPGTLPEPGTPVLLDIGKEYPIRAMWAAKHTVQAADDDTDWGEYVEEDDMYYAPEGWYEWNQCEDNHWRVTETPRAWMPLPPTSAEGVEHG